MKRSEEERKKQRSIICIGDAPVFFCPDVCLNNPCPNNRTCSPLCRRKPAVTEVVAVKDREEAAEYLGDPLGSDWFRSIHLHAGRRHIRFRLKDILVAEMRGHSLDLILAEQTIEDVRMPLYRLVQIVGSRYFVRCHNAYAVNLRHVTEVQMVRRKQWEAVFDRSVRRTCHVGSTYYPYLLELIREL